jgi:Mlc titration factor MtfA (ptsG expression regulator)
VVVYPGEFVPGWEWEDEAGVVHTNDEPMAGEAMHRGPVVLSWPDVAASADWEASGMNLAIHEFAHKLDMIDGDADGCPPLPPGMSLGEWKRTMRAAFDDFVERVDRNEDTAIDPYAAESPGEFFAVLRSLRRAAAAAGGISGRLRLLTQFYRQDPARGAAN